MFAEMLGIKRRRPEPVASMARSVDRPVASGDFVDELDVQKEVVEEMAREKAVLEESLNLLKAEKIVLEEEKDRWIAESKALSAANAALQGEKSALESEKAALVEEKRALEAQIATRDEEIARLQRIVDSVKPESTELASARAENAALETKLARMGRALMAARRAAAEAAKVEIGGRRW